MIRNQKLLVEYIREIPALRSGTDGPKAKYQRVLELDEREGRVLLGKDQPESQFWGGFAALGWNVPDDFDDCDGEIADLFEGRIQ